MLKVLPTAKISGIKGSPAQRELLCDAKENAIFEKIEGILVKKGEITSRELRKIFKEYAPGVYFRFATTPENKLTGSVIDLADKKSSAIKGFKITLPFMQKGSKKVLLDSDMETLMHEISHFIECIVCPKNIAKNNTASVYKTDKGFKKREPLYVNLFNNVLYPNELKSGETPLQAFLGAKGRIYNVINNYLEAFKNTPREEKIFVLQDFRHILKSERNAYQKGIIYQDKFDFNQQIRSIKTERAIGKGVLAGYRKTRETNSKIEALEYVDKTCFYKDKIAITEALLAEEIQNARELHALKEEVKIWQE